MPELSDCEKKKKKVTARWLRRLLKPKSGERQLYIGITFQTRTWVSLVIPGHESENGESGCHPTKDGLAEVA